MMASVLVFILGTIIGSFLNVVILRYNTGNSFLWGKSKCFSCGKKLNWYELVPVFSFLIQRGRCHGCKSKISWQYPVVEFITGLLFLLIFNYRGSTSIVEMACYWAVASLLMVIAVYDFRHQIIPNVFVWLFNCFAFLSLFQVSGFKFGVSSFLSGLVFAGFFALLWLISQGRWMGFGDAKLALGLGWLLGPEKTLLAFLFSFWLGAVVGIFLMFFRGNKFKMKSQIPFGPFLVAGSVVAFLVDFAIFDLILLK